MHCLLVRQKQFKHPVVPDRAKQRKESPKKAMGSDFMFLDIILCLSLQSMFEVLTSEASYLRSLRVLTEHFLDSRDLEDTMIIMDKKTLFSNILRVREVSER